MVALSLSLTRRRLPGPTLTFALACLLIAASLLSLTSGAAGLGVGDLLGAVWGKGLDLRDRVVLFDIRLPRLVLGAAVGAALAVSGVLLQGLFRNPLADPGIVGVSSGAGLGAVLAIVLGGLLPATLTATAAPVAAAAVRIVIRFRRWTSVPICAACASPRDSRFSPRARRGAARSAGAISGSAAASFAQVAPASEPMLQKVRSRSC